MGGSAHRRTPPGKMPPGADGAPPGQDFITAYRAARTGLGGAAAATPAEQAATEPVASLDFDSIDVTSPCRTPRWKPIIDSVRSGDAIDADEDTIPTVALSGGVRLAEAFHKWNELDCDGPDREPLVILDSPWVHHVVGVAVLLNTVVLVGHGGPEAPRWQLLARHAIILISSVEVLGMFIRIRAGVPFGDRFEMMYRLIDAAVVLGCLYEQWGQPLFWTLTSDSGHANCDLNQVSRILWPGRFTRIVLICPPLRELAAGIADALQGLFWVAVFMLLLLYFLAVICTRLIGKTSLLDPIPGSEPIAGTAQVKGMFSTVMTSLFFLFQTMSSWSLQPLFPLFEAAPLTRVIFSVFNIYAGWTLLAVMTGSVSFAMITIKVQQNRETELLERHKRAHMLAVIVQYLNAPTSPGQSDGKVMLHDFHMMLQSEEFEATLSTSNVSHEDLVELWAWLDFDNSGSVTYEEFMIGFQTMNEQLDPKAVLGLQMKLMKETHIVCLTLESLVHTRLGHLVERAAKPLRKINAIVDQVQIINVTQETLQQDLQAIRSTSEEIPTMQQSFASEASNTAYSVRSGAFDHPTPTSPRLSMTSSAIWTRDPALPSALAGLEQRLSEQLDAARARVERLAAAARPGPAPNLWARLPANFRSALR